MRSRTILIVDDEPRSREGMKKILEVWAAGHYEILTASNGISAMEILEEIPVELMISDIRMPGISGLSLVSQIRDKKYSVSHLLFSSPVMPSSSMLSKRFSCL